MTPDFVPTLQFIALEEGGYSADPRDSGNWSSGVAGVGVLIGSNKGCGAPATIAYVRANKLPITVTADWMKAIPEDVYEGMARQNYWNHLDGDDLPAGVDLAAMDFGWNTGPGNSAIVLQKLVGSLPDAQIGPKTIAAIKDPPLTDILAILPRENVRTLQALFQLDQDGEVGPNTRAAAVATPVNSISTVLVGLYVKQMLYYRSLSNWATYGNGWTARSQRRLSEALKLVSA